MKRILKFCLIGLLTLTSPLRADNKTYFFGVVPQQSASELAEKWVPFMAWLSAASGIKLRFATAPNIPEFEKRVSEGRYDIAYMNPYHYTVFHENPGYQAMAFDKERRIKGILVVHKDSSITDIKQLDGAELVFPSPAAFAASILPRAALTKQGINFTPKFVSSHDSVYLNVARGLSIAGGGIPRTLGMLNESLRNQIHILWTTPAYTAHAIATHPSLPKEVRAKLQEALLTMQDDVVGLKILQGIGFKSIATAKDSDWDDIRGLSIKELEDLK